MQCAAFGRRLTVEWRENHDVKDLSKFDHWRVEYPPDVETREGRQIRRRFIPAGIGNERWIGGVWRHEEAQEKQHELICFSDVLRIFQVFLEGKSPPPEFAGGTSTMN